MAADQQEPGNGETLSRSSSVAEAISREMVILQKEFGGKGPTECKTFIHRDLVLVLFGGGYSIAEQTLYDAGKWIDVRTRRTAFQDTMGVRFSTKIEELTGREVIAFMSANHQNPDLALEAFVLKPHPPVASTSS
jgi:uncharacterized protein YbcI